MKCFKHQRWRIQTKTPLSLATALNGARSSKEALASKDKRAICFVFFTCAFVLYEVRDRYDPLGAPQVANDALQNPFGVILSHDGCSRATLKTTTITAAAAATVALFRSACPASLT